MKRFCAHTLMLVLVTGVAAALPFERTARAAERPQSLRADERSAGPQVQGASAPATTPTPLTLEGLRPKGIVRMTRDGITELDSDMRPVKTPRVKQDAKGRRAAYIQAHPELSGQLRTAIAAGKPLVGMTREQVLACCGAPVDHQSSESSEGHLERWQYGFPGDELPVGYVWLSDPTDFHEFCFLTFVDSVLVSWECPR